MANTYAPLVAGSTIVWTDTGGSFVMTLASLANNAARQGPKSATLVDATKGLPAVLEVLLTITYAVAPTDLATADLYLSFSDSATAGTNNPGNLSGTDVAGVTASSELAQMVFAGSLVASNTIGTSAQFQRFLVVPQDAYVSPNILNNGSGQAFGGSATCKITITPWYQQSS